MHRAIANTLFFAVMVAFGISACHHHETPPTNDGGCVASDPAVPFTVRATSTDLLYFWFDDDGGAHAVDSVSDVPPERRSAVRVDPSRPELRVAGTIYLADLRAAGPDGTFHVRAVAAETLAAEIAHRMGLGAQGTPQEPPPPRAGSDAGTAVAHASQVIIYGASWCSACHQAAAYLRQRHVDFVERDIEREPGAQAEMMAKAQRAGVQTGSIPIIDVHGHIMVGFSAPAIEQALAGS